MGEKNLRENMPPPNSDPECPPELTRTLSNSSSSSSSVTLHASKELPLCCSHATLGASTEWTNEKHNLYLDSLETSFVNELYHSLRFRDWHKQKNVLGAHSSLELPFKTENSPDQFMVPQDGCLQKINLQRNALMESTANSHVTVASLRIYHLKSAGKGCNVPSPNRQEHVVSCNKEISLRGKLNLRNSCVSARSSEQNLICHQDSFDSTTEVSGQNFFDEDHGGKLSNESAKRLKRAAADASSNDQLVPSGSFDTKRGFKGS